MLLAIDSGVTTGKVDGIATQGPGVRHRRPCGSSPGSRDQAEMFGYTVVEPGGVLATHLTEVVRRHADEILTRDATKHLVDELKKTSPAVVDELIPGLMKLAEVQQILQMLLREQVPIRQLGADPGNARRLRRRDQGPGAAHRIRAAPAGPHDLHALPRRARTGCTWSRSIRRWKTAFAPASSTPSAGCSSACRRRRSRRPAELIAGRDRQARRAPSHPPIVLVSPQIRAGAEAD